MSYSEPKPPVVVDFFGHKITLGGPPERRTYELIGEYIEGRLLELSPHLLLMPESHKGGERLFWPVIE